MGFVVALHSSRLAASLVAVDAPRSERLAASFHALSPDLTRLAQLIAHRRRPAETPTTWLRKLAGLPAFLVLALALLAACSKPLKVPKAACGSYADSVMLATPEMGYSLAFFETTGGTVYFSAHHFMRGMLIDPAEGAGRTTFEIGHANMTPTHDEQRNTTTNVFRSVTVGENVYTPTDLPAGRYWVWGGLGSGDYEIASCTADTLTGTPAEHSDPLTPGRYLASHPPPTVPTSSHAPR